jgi:hypothetical protein
MAATRRRTNQTLHGVQVDLWGTFAASKMFPTAR